VSSGVTELTKLGRKASETNLSVLPSLLPVPKLDRHVVRTGKDEWQRRVNGEATDVVGVGFDRSDLLARVVVEDAEVEVVRAADEPVLALDEADASHRDLGDLEGLDDRLQERDWVSFIE
jgi:hypothetical protein